MKRLPASRKWRGFGRKVHGARTSENLSSDVCTSQPAQTETGIPTNKIRHKKRHSKFSTRELRQWFNAHSHHPYPSDQDKILLQQRSGLDIQQINQWFANARRRGRLKKDQHDTDFTPFSRPVPRAVPELESGDGPEELNPLNRWRNSPPEEEPADWTAIVQAASTAPLTTKTGLKESYSQANQLQSTWDLPTQSDISADSSWSESGGCSSTHTSSAGSNGSLQSLTGTECRSQTSHWRQQRHRRRRGSRISGVQQCNEGTSRSQRPYQCTFCTDAFKTKYDWTRHERTLHLNLEQWVCMPAGPLCLDLISGVSECFFCQQSNPDASHLKSHQVDTCISRPIAAKTFYRKDHMQQHLRLVHGVSDIRPSMSAWKSEIAAIECRCGFCGERFKFWSERNDHLAAHFQDGLTMATWKGDRGFIPAVALVVRNAMPPYLIGSEVNEFEPFSASKTAGPAQPCDDEQRPPTTFETLTMQLGDFVRTALREGIVINDESVKRRARLIMYGDDDAWNQTPADNPEWLRLFKNGLNLHGPRIETCASSSNLEASLDLDTSAAVSVFSNHPFAQPLLERAFGTQAELPMAWQTPECLAEFQGMLEQDRLKSVEGACGCGEAEEAFYLLGPSGSLTDAFSNLGTDTSCHDAIIRMPHGRAESDAFTE